MIVLVMGCLAGSSVVGANCNDDCKNEYVSGLSDCRSQYDQSKDLQDLEECLADSRSEYDDCIDDCTDLGAGGVMACSSAIGVELTSFHRSATPIKWAISESLRRSHTKSPLPVSGSRT